MLGGFLKIWPMQIILKSTLDAHLCKVNPSRHSPVICLSFLANSTIFSGCCCLWVDTATRSRPLPRHTLLQDSGWAGNSCQVCMVVEWHPWPMHSSLNGFLEMNWNLWVSSEKSSPLSFMPTQLLILPDRCLNLRNALREVSLSNSAHYLTITSEKMKE